MGKHVASTTKGGHTGWVGQKPRKCRLCRRRHYEWQGCIALKK